MDMQFGIATVVIILGLGITQIDGGQNEFLQALVGEQWRWVVSGLQ